MKHLHIATDKKRGVVDITNMIGGIFERETGLVHVFVPHTTCAVTTADLDPGTDRDMLDAFEKIIPNLKYRHPHDPNHVGDHIMSSLLGPDVAVPVREGQLHLGQWQRIVLVEFNGPRDRSVIVHFLCQQGQSCGHKGLY